jgi:hypothetical protein
MSYYEKLVKLLGREPVSLDYNQQILGLKTKEDSAKSLFNGLLSIPTEKKKAKKLGLI